MHFAILPLLLVIFVLAVVGAICYRVAHGRGKAGLRAFGPMPVYVGRGTV
jgi:hypothetical protein